MPIEVICGFLGPQAVALVNIPSVMLCDELISDLCFKIYIYLSFYLPINDALVEALGWRILIAYRFVGGSIAAILKLNLAAPVG